MGHSSLLGIEQAPVEPAGRDTAALGPSDSSDSGSDMAGIEEVEGGDTGLPVDVALRDDNQHSLTPGDVLGGSASDAAGTGERRSAGSDAGIREAADVGVDRVFTPGGKGSDFTADDEDADLEFVDEAQAEDLLDDEEEDAER